jgi:hypothetical protein
MPLIHSTRRGDQTVELTRTDDLGDHAIANSINSRDFERKPRIPRCYLCRFILTRLAAECELQGRGTGANIASGQRFEGSFSASYPVNLYVEWYFLIKWHRTIQTDGKTGSNHRIPETGSKWCRRDVYALLIQQMRQHLAPFHSPQDSDGIQSVTSVIKCVICSNKSKECIARRKCSDSVRMMKILFQGVAVRN